MDCKEITNKIRNLSEADAQLDFVMRDDSGLEEILQSHSIVKELLGACLESYWQSFGETERHDLSEGKNPEGIFISGPNQLFCFDFRSIPVPDYSFYMYNLDSEEITNQSNYLDIVSTVGGGKPGTLVIDETKERVAVDVKRESSAYVLILNMEEGNTQLIELDDNDFQAICWSEERIILAGNKIRELNPETGRATIIYDAEYLKDGEKPSIVRRFNGNIYVGTTDGRILSFGSSRKPSEILKIANPLLLDIHFSDMVFGDEEILVTYCDMGVMFNTACFSPEGAVVWEKSSQHSKLIQTNGVILQSGQYDITIYHSCIQKRITIDLKDDLLNQAAYIVASDYDGKDLVICLSNGKILKLKPFRR